MSKHAAVALAGWLSVTYGDRGVRVSCLCPMAVRTKPFEEGAAPGGPWIGLRFTNASAPLLDPDEVAGEVVRGLASERCLILPHAEVREMARARAAGHDGWLEGMRCLQASVRAVVAAGTPVTATAAGSGPV